MATENNHDLPNLCSNSQAQLREHVGKLIRRVRRRPILVTAFWKHVTLF